MRLFNECNVLLVVSKSPVYIIQISNCIAMVAGLLLVIFQNGVDPNGGHTEVLYIIEMVRDSFQVTPMPAKAFVAVSTFIKSGKRIVLQITIGETVRKNQVHNIT